MRKIDINAWAGKADDDSDSISDLATKNHELSVWQVKDDLSDKDDIALALALTRNDTNGIMTVLLDPEEIETQTGFKINIEQQSGGSVYLKKNGDHKNFMLYRLADMGKMALYIHQLLKTERIDSLEFYDELRLTEILKSKFRNGEIQGDEIKVKSNWYKKFKEYEKERKSHTSHNS